MAAVWKKVTAHGVFRTVSLSRSYKKNDEWKQTNSLGALHIDKAIEVLAQAREYLNIQFTPADELA